jgi:hypothetical protein
MEKYIVNQYGDITKYNTDDNTVFYPKHDECVCHVINEDSQVISDEEVIDTKAGDVILVFTKWVAEDSRTIKKVIVLSDPMANHDVKEWLNNR